MRLRALAVTTALALAATGLTACTSKIGQAAVVSGHRISIKEVDGYINPAGPSQAALAQAGANGAISPRPFVVNTLIRRQIILEALKLTPKGVPSSATVRAKYNDAANIISQGQATGGAAFDKALSTQIVGLGFRARLAQLYVQTFELEAVLVEQANVKSAAQLSAAIAKAHASVSVNPRFGTWDAAKLQLSSDPNAGLPSFVTIGSDTQSSPAPATGQ